MKTFSLFFLRGPAQVLPHRMCGTRKAAWWGIYKWQSGVSFGLRGAEKAPVKYPIDRFVTVLLQDSPVARH
jgi:hypothetical protein